MLHKQNTMKTFLIVLTLFFFNDARSQGFFNKLADRATDKIARKAEDKLVEELSEKIANEAVKPINSFVDSLFVESYEKETGEPYDYENSSKMAEALSAMFGDVDVPEKYEFDINIDVELKDFGSKKSEKMKMFISKSQPIFGIEKNEGKEKAMIIFDNTNEAMVTYDLNEKKLFAIKFSGSSFAALGQAMAEKHMEEMDWSVKKTGKTKKILGYHSEEHLYESKEDISSVYVADKVPFTWDESFGTMMQQMAPNFYKENEEFYVNGMVLEAKTTRKEDDKKSEWKVKKINEKSFEINNSKFEKQSIADYHN